MKKIFAWTIMIFLLTASVLAAGEGGNGSGSDDVEPQQGMVPDAGQGEKAMAGETIMAQEMARVRAQSPDELRQIIQSRQQKMSQEMQSMVGKEQAVYQNQNKVRLAVHSLLAMEDLVGGIGPQVREVARNFNNSVQATIMSEERIQKRNAISRLFAGGDHESAEEIERQVEQNRQKIQELKQLKEECDCEEEVKAIMQEQIQNMEQEQTRLGELAQKEKQSKGLFGWLWK